MIKFETNNKWEFIRHYAEMQILANSIPNFSLRSLGTVRDGKVIRERHPNIEIVIGSIETYFPHAKSSILQYDSRQDLFNLLKIPNCINCSLQCKACGLNSLQIIKEDKLCLRK